ncbi:DUF6891 domain-containing protein [Hydrogenophaga sp. PBL-H3]|uniref:DUF6891 domain-containing protein n=1 Tax=Hydrogenophaga sp. PBL-H3 TaxID=434010 RepID=UPI00131F48A6|nr:hypothetical protein [Hydrogenophaga sp. PBL-H3]QHE77650.1 hypothetical protein F9Z45_17250 [Hydrogenophaga sp. PBL-H3]QHE82074.1 hypothetical protein F9Z44_17250 [Hydrogenophaga sp. PBL-H3]
MTDAKRPSLDENPDRAAIDATHDMASVVENLIWYGFQSAADIDALIDEGVTAGDGFDVARVKAFAATTLAKKRAAEATWPHATDCDKLDRAFARLHEQGICALHCTGDTQDDGFEAVIDALSDDGVPEDRYHGYCFYYSQDIDRALDEEGLLLAYGHLGRSEVKEREHLAVGQLVCEALRHEGLTVAWNGSTKRRISLAQLDWQRRTPG